MKNVELNYYKNLKDVLSFWQDIFAQSSLSYFSSWQWHIVVKEFLKNTFITKYKNNLTYFSAKEINNNTEVKLVGFFYLKKNGRKKTIQFAHLLGPSDYYDFIYKDDIDPLFIKQVIDKIAKDKGVTEVSFAHVRKDSKLYKTLSLFSAFHFEFLKCVSISLVDCYEVHLKKLRKSVRQNLRTANNRIRKNNIAQEITYLTSNDLSSIDFEQLKSIYKKRSSTKVQNTHWKTKIYKLLDDPFRREIDMFDIDVIRETDFVLGIIKFDNNVAAYFFGLKNKSGIEINRVAINDEYRKYSPGMVLLDEFIKKGFELGMQTIDLTVGDEKYKYDLGGETHEIINAQGKVCLD
jgi:hypothetical protein